jgi:hypothetical protein
VIHEPASAVIPHLVRRRPSARRLQASEYGRVILPFTVLRRLDCVLAPTKDAALKEHAARQAAGIAFEPFDRRDRRARPRPPTRSLHA